MPFFILQHNHCSNTCMNYPYTDCNVCYFFSMGGAIAVHAAIRHLVPSLIGLIVIDVVEGKCAVK